MIGVRGAVFVWGVDDNILSYFESKNFIITLSNKKHIYHYKIVFFCFIIFTKIKLTTNLIRFDITYNVIVFVHMSLHAANITLNKQN